MEEKKIKKKKLTLSVSSKKSYEAPRYTHTRNKTSVVIEKKVSRRGNDRKFYSRDNNLTKSKLGHINKIKSQLTDDSTSKSITKNRNFEIRKIAEERATKRFKDLKKESLQPKKVA